MQNRIKELREKRNLTLDDVQIQTGINRGTFSNYENGTTEPKVFRISSQDADKVNCCPFCKEFYLSISKAN